MRLKSRRLPVVVFKNFIRAGAVHFVQADCTRLAGIAGFIAVGMLARKHGLPLVPHVGDMGQIHQHLVLFNGRCSRFS